MANSLVLKTVNSLSERWLKNISNEFLDKEVYIVDISNRKKVSEELFDILNERFVRKQLGLEIPSADNRDLWYQVFDRLHGEVDLSGDSLQQQISFDGMVKNFCSKLIEFFNAIYWGYVQDELNIKSKARAVAFTINGQSYLMDSTTITKEYFQHEKNEFFNLINETPFGFIICEKEEVLKSTMRQLKDNGYKYGWLGIGTQGYASTPVIRLLMEYKEKISDRFFVFVIHDLDIDGIKIYLDMKRYFPCESAGLNPQLIKRVGIDVKPLFQKYKGKDGKAKDFQIKGALTLIDELFVSDIIDYEEREELHSWIEYCSERRLELQSLTGHRIEEDMTQNPARDYAEYIEYLLTSESRIFNLNRYDEPNWKDYSWEDNIKTPSVVDSKPSFIESMRREILSLISDKLDSFLKDYDKEDFWTGFVSDVKDSALEYLNHSVQRKMKILTNHRDIMIDKNKDYKDSLTLVKDCISKQTNELKRIKNVKQHRLELFANRINEAIKITIENTEEYNSAENILLDFKDTLENILEKLD